MALASLTACGDKTTIVQPTSSQNQGSVRTVTVTPATANLNIGDQINLAASVNADPSITDRTVTWTTSNAAIATVDAAGAVKAIATGSATITAASKANPSVTGAALITVGAVNNPVVTISTINQTNGFNSVPANLGNVAGQIDVTLNVDPGSQKLAGVDLVMNCAAANGNSGKDTVVATQSLAAATVAAAEEAAAPITLSFNTAQFTQATGAPAFFNGSCNIKGQARTTSGTTVATANTAITLNNADVVIGAITSTKNATDAGGLAWHGGDVTVTTTPVFYSGRVAATTVVSFEGKNQTVTGAGTKTVTFVDANDLPGVVTGNQSPAANDIDNITDAAANVTFNLVDAAGNNFTTNPCGNTICTLQTALLATAPTAVVNATSPFRLDTQAPKPGRFLLANNTDQGTTVNGYIGANFRFAADSAAGYRGPDSTSTAGPTTNLDRGGVDKVAVAFQTATSITGTFNTVTTTSGLAETNTATANILRQVTTDALGNADTAFVGTGAPVEFRTVTSSAGVPATAKFGVDVTAPTVTFNAAASIGNQIAVNGISTAVYNFSFTDNLSGTGLVYVAQVRNWNGLSGTQSAAEGKSYTNTGAPNTVAVATSVTDTSPCTIGRYNASQAAAGAGAVQAFDRSGAAIGYCTPVPFNLAGGVSVTDNAVGLGGYYTTVVIASDEAGNRAPAFTSQVLENPTVPTVANIDLPGSITGNATASFPASVTETSGANVGDISRSWAQLEYTTVPGSASSVTFQYPITAGPGVAFDNVLTRTATVTPTITNFAKSLTISNGTAAVTAATNNADSVKVFAADPAQVGATTAPNAGSLAVKLAPSVQLVAGSTSSFAAQFTAGFRDSVSSTNASLTGSITLFATAQGTTGIFNNPFSGGAVTFWYRLASAPATSPWFYISSTSSGVTQDTGAANGRSWIFTSPFTPPASAPDGTLIPSGTSLVIRAVGVNANGDAVGTLGTTAITVTP